MTSKFECEASPATANEFRGEDIIKVPAVDMRYTHNGYQWFGVKMTPEEWLEAIAAVTEHIED